MIKIKTLFKINPETNLVEDEVVEGSEWVLNNEGVPTEKFDGTACMIREGILYKRYDRKLPPHLYKEYKKGLYIPKREDFKEPPPFFEEVDDSALSTGHIFGWIPVDEKHPENQYHIEAFNAHKHTFNQVAGELTFELMGPRINGNSKGLKTHQLWRHGSVILYELHPPYTFESLKKYFLSLPKHVEGVVWHHPDGRMVKLRVGDFKKRM